MDPFSLPAWPAETPDWLTVELDERRAHTSAVRIPPDVEIDEDLRGNVFRGALRLRDLVDQGHVAIEDSGSDQCVYDTFGELRDLGLSKDCAIELMLKHYIPYCRGHFTYEWVEAKAENLWEYGKSSPGCWANEPSIDVFSLIAVVENVKTEAERQNALIPFTAILAMKVEPVQEIVKHLIERGIPNFIVGHGGTHKSRLSLQWGVAAACGAPVFTTHTTEKCPLVYVSTEDDQNEINRRLTQITKRLDIADGAVNAHLMDRKGKASALAAMQEGGDFTLLPFRTLLVEALQSIPGHKFVVLDSCVDLVTFLGKAKIDESAVNAFIKIVLQDICDVGDCTLLVIWHTSQSGRETGSGWSVAWENAPRSRLLIKENHRQGVFELSQTKRNHGPRMTPIALHWDRGALMPYTEDTKLMSAAKAILVECCLEAAETGNPQPRRGAIQSWIITRIVKELGEAPSDREMHDMINAAARNKELMYKSSSPSGWIAWSPEGPEPVKNGNEP